MPAARFRPAERPAVISALAEDPPESVLGRLGLPTGRRLLALVAAAALVVLVLVGMRANALMGAKRAAGAAEHLVGVTVPATTLVYELQQERDYSVGFVSSGGKVGADLVALQHVDVDDALKDYRAARDQVTVRSGSVVQDRLDAADAQLVKLDQVRAAIDKGGKSTPAEISAEYATTIGALIAILPAVADDSSNPSLVASARGLGALAEAKEVASAQRGFLYGVLTVNKFASKDGPAELTAIGGKLQAALDRLSRSADEEQKAIFDSTVDADAVKQSDGLVASVLAAPGGQEFDVGAAQWFDTASTRIDLMREAEALFTTSLIDDAGSASSAARWRLLTEGPLLLLVLAGTLGLVLLALTGRGGRPRSGASSAAVRRRVLALAGHRPIGVGGPLDRPADLKDVVHAAATQIDDQARVVQGTMAPRAVTTAAAGDVMVIVTELLDNAAAFSDPQTRVFVKTKSSVDGGAVVEVEDQGSGMSAGELAAANALLAGNMDEGSAGSGLGLFVVGQLAARHSIQVQLRAGEEDNSGVTAVVRLPAAVVVLSTGSRGADVTGTRETPVTREPISRAATAGSAALREGPGNRDSALPRREPGASRPDLSPFGSASTGESTQIWDFPSKPREVPDLPWSTAQQPAVPPATPQGRGPGDPATTWPGTSGGLFGTPPPLARRQSAPDTPPSPDVIPWDATPPPIGRDTGAGHLRMPQTPRWEPDIDVEPAAEPAKRWNPDIWGTEPSFSEDLGADSANGLGRRLPSERFDMPGPADVTLPDISRVVPPIDEPAISNTDVRLSIFDAIESEWFRQRAVGDFKRDELSDSWEQPAVHWSSPADEGWRAAERLQEAHEPPAVTSAGLPQRVPMANFVPGSIAPPAEASTAQRPAHPRSAEMVREMLSTYHRGVREGRHAKHRR
jgi:anti-sigma regulatory factor (Ser/Thr protein kinase)